MIQQCINCHAVWEDKSSELKPFCSAKCEKDFEEHDNFLSRILFNNEEGETVLEDYVTVESYCGGKELKNG